MMEAKLKAIWAFFFFTYRDYKTPVSSAPQIIMLTKGVTILWYHDNHDINIFNSNIVGII